MQFAATDIAAMLGAFGDTVVIGAQIYFDQVGDFDAITTLLNVGITGGVEYRCLFDAPGKVANLFTGGIETTAPMITMAASDAATAGVAHGTPVVIDGALYYVIAIDPDGAGFTALTLSNEAP